MALEIFQQNSLNSPLFDFNSSIYSGNTLQQYQQNAQQTVNNTQFNTGLTLQQSNDFATRLKGKNLVNTAIQNQISTLPTASNGKTDYWNSAFNTLNNIGQQIGGKAGNALSRGSQLGSSIKTTVDSSKTAGGWKNLTGTQKAGNVGAIVGAASDMIGSFMPEKQEYSGPKGEITSTMDNVYDGISDAAMSIPGVGTLVGGIMKGGKLVGQLTNALGGGTDAMTSTDAILGSSFFNLTPIGLINGFGGKKSDTITKNNEAFAQVGSSYTGSNSTVDDALQKSGKKYGLFSSGARQEANREIAEAARQQNIISNIADTSQDMANLRTGMSAFNANRYALQLQGGYNQANVRVGKHGMLLQKARSIIKASKGNKLEPFDIYYQSLPENQRDSTNFRVRDYWEFNGQPKDFNEAIQKGMFTKLSDGWHARSVMENPNTGEIEYMKSENHPTRYMESDWYEKGLVYNDNGTITQLKPGVEGYEDWKDFTNNYELQKTSPYWKYVKRKSSKFQNGGSIIELSFELPEFKNGGSVIELVKDSIIEMINPFELPEFKNGGSVNVLPNGALHAHKHNMENAENLTKKGIPVVDNNGEQQAEVEREELILRLEVTKKIEELGKKYYDEESSQKEKEEYALEAGQLLVEEILHNTDDKTGLIGTLKKGGVINSTDIDKMVKQALINILIK